MSDTVYETTLRPGDDYTIHVLAERTPGWGGVVSLSVRCLALGATLSLSSEEARELGLSLMDAANASEKPATPG